MSRLPLLGVAALSLAGLAGCASIFPPSTESMARLPIVEFPAPPPTGDFILKLPAGKPIPARIIVDGTALASGADQTVNATLPNDLFLHRGWVSRDGKTWQRRRDVLDVRLAVSLPSDEHPAPGKIHLTVDKVAAP